MPVNSKSLILVLAPIVLAAAVNPAFSQEGEDELESVDQIMEDALDLNDPALSIWPTVNAVEIEALSGIVEDLERAYEADREDADERTRAIDAMIAEAEQNEEVTKAKIKVAKEADDDEMKEKLEELKDAYALREKYLGRISRLRAEERKLAEARIDYVSQLSEVIEIARSLLEARESGERSDLLATERELIRQSKELGDRLDAVAGSLKKVNSERDKTFDEREKLIAASN